MPRVMHPSHYYQSDPRYKVDPRMDPRMEPRGRGDLRNEPKGYQRNDVAAKVDPRYGADQGRGNFGRTGQRNGDFRK